MESERIVAFFGCFVLIFVAWLMSDNRKMINWRVVYGGTALQFIFAWIVLRTDTGRAFFEFMNDVIMKLLDFTAEGSKFVFGSLITNVSGFGFIFAFQVLPTIIFFCSFMTVLYYLGVMQVVVKFFAWIMAKTMQTSGAETLSASANIFMGQTEAPLLVKPFIEKMTMSELMCVMTGGMATIAGSVMAAYVGLLRESFPTIAGHLLAASIMSAPAAMVMSKLMVPETGKPVTQGTMEVKVEQLDVNVIDAAARGAGEGLGLALNVAAMLMAFISLIAMVNYLLMSAGDGINRLIGKDPHVLVLSEEIAPAEAESLTGQQITLALEKPQYGAQKLMIFQGTIKAIKGTQIQINENLYADRQEKISYSITKNGAAVKASSCSFSGAWKFSMEVIFGFLLAPLAWLMGTPWKDAMAVGYLIGEKTVLNEFVAYLHFGDLMKNVADLSDRAKLVITYALCGFSNFSSIAIQIAGIGGLAPSRKHDLAKLGLRAMIAGSLACFMTAAIASVLF